METTITTEQKRNDLQGKENWSKPEVNLIGINEDTLGVPGLASADATSTS
jgi:hypothetical protein